MKNVINWFSIGMVVLGICVVLLGALNENLSGFQFVGGYMFGFGLARLRK